MRVVWWHASMMMQKKGQVRISAKTVEELIAPISLLRHSKEKVAIMRQLVDLAGKDLFRRLIKLVVTNVDPIPTPLLGKLERLLREGGNSCSVAAAAAADAAAGYLS